MYIKPTKKKNTHNNTIRIRSSDDEETAKKLNRLSKRCRDNQRILENAN